jgi:Transposase
MQQKTIDFNTATYVGIDAHPSEHTAVAVNRFEEEKGSLNFENNWNGIKQFLSWLQTIDSTSHNVIIGVEGRGGKGSDFTASMLDVYEHVYEVNPQYTRQRRQFAEVIIKKLPELPEHYPGGNYRPVCFH